LACDRHHAALFPQIKKTADDGLSQGQTLGSRLANHRFAFNMGLRSK
jgi:hypothetical protein